MPLPKFLKHIALFAAATLTVSAQSLPPSDFTARFVRDDNGDASIEWQTTPGYADTLERSADSLEWSPVGAPVYGFGHLVSVAVPGARRSTAGGAPAEAVPSYPFLLLYYPASHQIVASWLIGDSHYRKTLSSPWVGLEFPLGLMHTVPEPEPGYRLCITRFEAHARAWPLPDSAALPPEAEAYLAKLTGEFDAIAAELANPDPPTGSQQIGSGSESADRRFLYRVRRTWLDSDGDGLNDFDELAGGFGDPFDADTDDDGTRDYDPATLDDADADTDGDGVRNGEDAVPYDELLSWARSPEARYLMLRLPQSIETDGRVFINNEGRIAFVERNNGIKLHTWKPGDDEVETFTAGTAAHTFESLIGIDDDGTVYFSQSFDSGDPASPLPEITLHRWPLGNAGISDIPQPEFPGAPGNHTSPAGGIPPYAFFNAYDFPGVNAAGELFCNTYYGATAIVPWPNEAEPISSYYQECVRWGLIRTGNGWVGWNEFDEWWGPEVVHYPAQGGVPAHDELTLFYEPNQPVVRRFHTFAAISRGGAFYGHTGDSYPFNPEPPPGATYLNWAGTASQSVLVPASLGLYPMSQNDWAPEIPQALTPTQKFRPPFRPGNLTVCNDSRLALRKHTGQFASTLFRNWTGRPDDPAQSVSPPISGGNNRFYVNNCGEILHSADPSDLGTAAIWRNGRSAALWALIAGEPDLLPEAINDSGVIAAVERVQENGVTEKFPVVLVPISLDFVSRNPITEEYTFLGGTIPVSPLNPTVELKTITSTVSNEGVLTVSYMARARDVYAELTGSPSVAGTLDIFVNGQLVGSVSGTAVTTGDDFDLPWEKSNSERQFQGTFTVQITDPNAVAVSFATKENGMDRIGRADATVVLDRVSYLPVPASSPGSVTVTFPIEPSNGARDSVVLSGGISATLQERIGHIDSLFFESGDAGQVTSYAFGLRALPPPSATPRYVSGTLKIQSDTSTVVVNGSWEETAAGSRVFNCVDFGTFVPAPKTLRVIDTVITDHGQGPNDDPPATPYAVRLSVPKGMAALFNGQHGLAATVDGIPVAMTTSPGASVPAPDPLYDHLYVSSGAGQMAVYAANPDLPTGFCPNPEKCEFSLVESGSEGPSFQAASFTSGGATETTEPPPTDDPYVRPDGPYTIEDARMLFALLLGPGAAEILEWYEGQGLVININETAWPWIDQREWSWEELSGADQLRPNHGSPTLWLHRKELPTLEKAVQGLWEALLELQKWAKSPGRVTTSLHITPSWWEELATRMGDGVTSIEDFLHLWQHGLKDSLTGSIAAFGRSFVDSVSFFSLAGGIIVMSYDGAKSLSIGEAKAGAATLFVTLLTVKGGSMARTLHKQFQAGRLKKLVFKLPDGSRAVIEPAIMEALNVATRKHEFRSALFVELRPMIADGRITRACLHWPFCM
jgi:hypothetical protein